MRRTIFLICICLSGLTMSGQNFEFYKTYGDSLIKLKEYAKLIEFFEGEIKKYPENDTICQYLGLFYFNNKQIEQAVKNLKKAIFLNPECINCYTSLASIYATQRDFEKAIQYADTAIDLDKKSGDPLALRARIHNLNGNTFYAKMDFNKAFRKEIKNPQSYIWHAKFNNQQGFSVSAISNLEKAISMDSTLIEARIELAMIHFYSGHFEDVISEINTVLKHDKENAMAYNILATAYKELQDFETSEELFNLGIDYADSSELHMLLYNRTSLYHSMEDMERKCADLNSLIVLSESGWINDTNLTRQNEIEANAFCDSNFQEYFYQRGIAAYNLSQYEEAINWYKKGLNRFPDSYLTLSFLGNAYYKNNQFDEALAAYYEVLKNAEKMKIEIRQNERARFMDNVDFYYNGNLAQVHQFTAECLLYINKPEEALAHANSALSISRDIPDLKDLGFFYTRGLVNLMLMRFQEAIADFNADLETRENPEAKIYRAIARMSLLGNINKQAKNINPLEGVDQDWFKSRKAITDDADLLIIERSLEDCNEVIEKYPEYAHAYYNRALIKYFTKSGDHCPDLILAKKFGQEINENHTLNCDLD
ncbi:MAG: tetratricopeptide repeat protein [Cryomorphaceae bacterium]|nr:tetratricopeptide repeat protein [Cryomorphaceae bacterium]